MILKYPLHIFMSIDDLYFGQRYRSSLQVLLETWKINMCSQDTKFIYTIFLSIQLWNYMYNLLFKPIHIWNVQKVNRHLVIVLLQGLPTIVNAIECICWTLITSGLHITPTVIKTNSVAYYTFIKVIMTLCFTFVIV